MIRSLLLSCILLSNFASAEEESVFGDSISHQILMQKPEAVLFQTESRLYLRPEKIYPTSEGLFLGDAQSAIPIPMVFSDASGCYFPCGNFFPSERYWICWNEKCKNYHKVFRNRSGDCPLCGREGEPG